MHSLIAKWVSSNQTDWDEKLPAVAFAYRTTIHESTGFTPYFLMHGREARVPADLVYGEPDISSSSIDGDFPSRLQNNLHEAFGTARQNIGQAAKRRKDRYDLRAQPATLPVGSWVWCWHRGDCLAATRNGGPYTKDPSRYRPGRCPEILKFVLNCPEINVCPEILINVLKFLKRTRKLCSSASVGNCISA